jgi:hypothetical protein
MKQFETEYLNLERNLKIIYVLLAFAAVLPEVYFALGLLPNNRFVEFVIVNIGGTIVTVFVHYSLEGILRKNPSLRMYIREELWLLIVVLVITSYGVRDPLGISVANPFTITGPSLLLGASFLILLVSATTFNRIRRWEKVGIRTSEIPDLIGKLSSVFQDKEHQEISATYKSASYLVLLFITEQVNLLLILVSSIFDKLIDESLRTLNIPVPKDDYGREPGSVKKATYLGLNLTLDNSDFDFDKFWGIRSKYIHHTIDKATEIIPSEIEIENSIKLVSKVLRVYPTIISKFDPAVATW